MPTRMRITVRSNPYSSTEIRVIKNLILSYFNIERKNIADMVPKTIVFHLIKHSQSVAQSELVNAIYSDPNKNDLLVEDPNVAINKENCQKVIFALR